MGALTTTRIALYVRVSDDRMVDPKQHPENQLEQLRAHVSTKPGWSITREYTDRETGAKGRGAAGREGFDRLFRDAALTRRPFDMVLVWSLDRFSREGVLQTHQHLAELDRLGVGFMSYTEPYIDTAGIFRDVIISLLASLAAQERQRHIERVKAGLARAKSQGKVFGRAKIPVEVAVLRKMVAAGFSLAEMAGVLGCSAATVGRRLVEAGLSVQSKNAEGDNVQESGRLAGVNG